MALKRPGEPMVMDNVTLLITTHNRPLFLRRLLRSLDAYNFYAPVMILDSSAEKSSLPEIGEIVSRRGIQWLRFDSSKGQAVKLFEAALLVKTPYVVLCADDDLMVFPFIQDAVRFLDEHADFTAVNGETVSFQLSGVPGRGSLKNIGAYPQRELSKASSAERLVQHLDFYTPLAYAVQRTADFQQAMSLWNAAGCEPVIFTELFTSSVSIILGKARKMDRLFYLRQKDISTELVKPFVGRDFFDWLTRESFHKEYQAFSLFLARLIREKQGLSQEESELVVRRAFGGYLRSCFVARRHLLEKRYSWDQAPTGLAKVLDGMSTAVRALWRQSIYRYKKYIGCQGVVNFLNPISPYYSDFKPLYELIIREK